jgi:hypothetical protein
MQLITAPLPDDREADGEGDGGGRQRNGDPGTAVHRPQARRGRHPAGLPGVVAGIGGYGNCLGLPNIGGEVVFDESYAGNPLVNALCVGVMRHEELHRAHASGMGNLVVLYGATTGGDGIGGVPCSRRRPSATPDPAAAERSGRRPVHGGGCSSWCCWIRWANRYLRLVRRRRGSNSVAGMVRGMK